MVKLKFMIMEITQWIDDNIELPLKIDDISKKSGYSKWHLQRVFYEEHRITLANYIRNKKLNLAALDLIYSNESICYISLKYGFDSQQSFTRSFKNKYKVSPLKFKNTKGILK